MIEEPGGQGYTVLAQICATDGASHPVTDPQFDLPGECVKLPQTKAVFQVDCKGFGILLWDVGLSTGRGYHLGSIECQAISINSFHPPVPETGRSVLSGGHDCAHRDSMTIARSGIDIAVLEDEGSVLMRRPVPQKEIRP